LGLAGDLGVAEQRVSPQHGGDALPCRADVLGEQMPASVAWAGTRRASRTASSYPAALRAVASANGSRREGLAAAGAGAGWQRPRLRRRRLTSLRLHRPAPLDLAIRQELGACRRDERPWRAGELADLSVAAARVAPKLELHESALANGGYAIAVGVESGGRN